MNSSKSSNKKLATYIVEGLGKKKTTKKIAKINKLLEKYFSETKIASIKTNRSFIIYARDNEARIMKENPDASFRKQMDITFEEWNALSYLDKRPYWDRAEKDKIENEEKLARNFAKKTPNQSTIFGFEDENTVIEANMSDIYGCAHYDTHANRWDYRVGSFPYIFGFYNAIIGMSGCKDDYETFAMFVLGENLVPLKIIPHLYVSPALKKLIGGSDTHGVTYRDLIAVNLEFTPPPMDFEY
jgi:hypothetical protein